VAVDLLARRRDEVARRWRVEVDETTETESSLVAYGRRDGRQVVLKVVQREGDEWHSGDVLRAFGGRGTVVLLESAPGALLMERLIPGTSLVTLVETGGDNDATDIIAGVIASMAPAAPPSSCPAIRDWGKAFTSYLSSRDSQIPDVLIDHARSIFAQLEGSQTNVRLLHGDLQHSNVLFDGRRGWVTIDPKGVIGELEYEIGAALRNPRELPDLIGDPVVIQRRLDRYVTTLGLDRRRTLGWAFAQAVLSMIWTVEDNRVLAADDPSRRLAVALRPMLQENGF
jgi:streptomycin 6-kinase